MGIHKSGWGAASCHGLPFIKCSTSSNPRLKYRRQVIYFVAVYWPGAQQLADDFKGRHLLYARDSHKEGAFVAARGGLRLNRWSRTST